MKVMSRLNLNHLEPLASKAGSFWNTVSPALFLKVEYKSLAWLEKLPETSFLGIRVEGPWPRPRTHSGALGRRRLMQPELMRTSSMWDGPCCRLGPSQHRLRPPAEPQGSPKHRDGWGRGRGWGAPPSDPSQPGAPVLASPR